MNCSRYLKNTNDWTRCFHLELSWKMMNFRVVITHCVMIKSDLSWTVSVHGHPFDKDKWSACIVHNSEEIF